MLLIHSGVGAADEWDLVRERVDGDAFDLYGFGDAPDPVAPWSHAAQAAERLAGPDVVCGASFGGMVALELASSRPELVERLVLLAPAFEPWDWGPEMQELGAVEEAGDRDAAVEANVALWAPAGFEDDVRRRQRRAFERQEDLPEPEEVAIDLARLTMPVTVLVGDADLPDFLAIARHIGEHVPHARVEVLPGAGHLLALERPDDVARALRA